MFPRRPLLTLALALLTACSSSADEGEADARAGDITGTDTWKNGLKLTGSITITANAVVDIEPGAVISCNEGVTIFVAGTLRAKAAAKHAKITCKGWTGISVSSGGKVDVEGLETENAILGLGLAEGAQESRFVDGAITSARKPLFVGTKAKLNVSKTKISAPDTVPDSEVSISEIYGTLVASRIEYDAKVNEGISARRDGTVEIEDSVLKGVGGLDMVSAYGAKSVKVAYTTMNGAHCGIHIDNHTEQGKAPIPTAAFTLDHVSSDPNQYAITIYGAGAGPNLVKDSNMIGQVAWIDFKGDNGPVTFDNVYTTGSEAVLGGPAPTFKNKPTAPVPNAKPR
ncbi:MAG: hypothetical protein JST00_28685 [Deltaproteobacteria bacterium]|nr:hypothetical protein [Deltaproteobacteria bacterium]